METDLYCDLVSARDELRQWKEVERRDYAAWVRSTSDRRHATGGPRATLKAYEDIENQAEQSLNATKFASLNSERRYGDALTAYAQATGKSEQEIEEQLESGPPAKP